MLTDEEIDAIAETTPGAVHQIAKLQSNEKEKKTDSREQTTSAKQVPKMSFASVGQDGKVKIVEAVEDSKA